MIVSLYRLIIIFFFSKEIAMVTHQLMSTRHLQLVKDKKTKDMSPPEGKIVRNLRIT